jgi:hypothetical protein
MGKQTATEQQAAVAIAAYNAFVELWNRTPQDQRRVLHEGPDTLELNPDVPWPIELLDEDGMPQQRPGQGRIRGHQVIRFRLPDGAVFDLRTRGAWRPFAAGDGWQRLPLAAADVRRAWVVAPAPARR